MTFKRMLAVLLASAQVAGLGLAAAAEGVGEERIPAEVFSEEEAYTPEEALLIGEEEAPAEFDGYLPAEPDAKAFPDVVREDAAEPLSGDPNEVVDSGACGDNLTWTLYGDGLLEISGEGEMWDFRDYYDMGVYYTDAPWRQYRADLTHLQLNHGVTKIGKNAFYACSNVYDYRNNSNQIIGFTGTLIIPDSVTEIGDNAFRWCPGFTGDLVIPDSVVSIGNNAFQGSGFDGSLILGTSVETIGGSAFSPYSSWSDSYFIGTLTIPDSVKTIGAGAFSNCRGFSGNLSIGENVEKIGWGAFENCTGFTGELIIPDSVSVIDGYAFYNCTGFTLGLKIPDSISTIGSYAFYGCTGMVGTLILPAGIIEIPDYCFSGCKNLIGTLTIPEGIRKIGNDAFSGCTGFMGNLKLPESLTEIGAQAFAQCNGFMGTLVLPSNLKTISNSAFWGCSGFKGDLAIPDSVETIGTSSFSCTGFNGALSLSNKLTLIPASAFSNCSFTGSLVIPDSVLKIDNNAFEYSGFTGDLTLGTSVSTIGENAFASCQFGGNLTLPDSLLLIGNNAFKGCQKFTGTLVLPENLISIGHYAFQWFGHANSVLNIPASVQGIGNYAFNTWTDLSSVNFAGDAPELGEKTFGEPRTNFCVLCEEEHQDSFTSDANYDASAGTWYGYTLAVSGGETTEDYTLTYYSGPTKKTYTVGDTFDTTGLYIYVKDKNGTVIASLTGTNLVTLPYTFTDTDISASGKTTTISISVVYQNKVYLVPIPGLTVTPAKKTLKLNVSSLGIINKFSVDLKRNSYPVGTTLSLNDVDYIYGTDYYGNNFMISGSDLGDYANTFSLEVAAIRVDSNGNVSTSRKSSSYRYRIESADVYTNRMNQKVVYLRFYVDSDYYEFEYDSGDSDISVYYGSTLLDIYDSLTEALADVNDLDHKWGGGSGYTYASSRTLTIKMGKDDSIGRYDYLIPQRNIEIDLNGHKLTMYTDSFRFRDKNDSYVVNISNSSSSTARIVYSDMTVDDLLVDKNEKITFKYQDTDNNSVPGIYTIAVSNNGHGTVTARPAVSSQNTVSIAHGNDVTFTIIPNNGYAIDTVKVKAGNAAEQIVSVPTNPSYSLNTTTGVATFTMKDVRSDATLTATFAAVIPDLTITPTTRSAYAGETVTFTASVIRGVAPYTFQWQYLKPGYSEWTNVTSESGKTAEYSFQAETVHNGWQFRCTLTDGNGNSATSQAALLVVITPSDLLEITENPASQEVSPGTPASFTVSATGGREPYTYQWQYLKPGAAAWVNVASASGKTKTYSLTALLRHNGYKYRCRITDADGNTVLSDEALLTVRAPENPLTVTEQPVDRTVTPGTTVSFTVTAEGGKAPYAYQWQYQKPGASSWTNVSAASGKTDTYTLRAELRHNGYTYRCRITDADGTAVLSDTALLTVAGPFTVTFQPEDRTVLSGQSAPFVTAASGGVQPYAYRWQYQKPGTGTWTNVTPASGGDTSCFTVPKAAARHNGWVIRCRIRDAVGSEIYTNLVTLTVDSTSAPVLTQAPVGASATPGETVTFSVRAEGPGKLSYQWQYLKPGASAWVNVSAASGKTQDYSLKVEMRHNGYRYRVAVSSDNGTSTVSGAVYLDVWEEILGAGDMLNGFGSVGPMQEEDPDFGWDLPVLDLSEKEEALWDLGLITEADLLRPADEAE